MAIGGVKSKETRSYQKGKNPISHQLFPRECFYLLVSLIFFYVQRVV